MGKQPKEVHDYITQTCFQDVDHAVCALSALHGVSWLAFNYSPLGNQAKHSDIFSYLLPGSLVSLWFYCCFLPSEYKCSWPETHDAVLQCLCGGVSCHDVLW